MFANSSTATAIGRNSNWLPHAVLWLGVLITAFPLYVTFIASTLTPQDIAQVPMQMLPGAHWWDNYKAAWSKGRDTRTFCHSACPSTFAPA